MKIRKGFVSNSSSSSFIIKNANKLSKYQINKITNHIHFGSKMKLSSYPYSTWDGWHLKFDECSNCGKLSTIRGSTSMDNFPMSRFLLEIGVPEEDIIFNGDNY